MSNSERTQWKFNWIPANQTNSSSSSAPSLKTKIKNDDNFVFEKFPKVPTAINETNVTLVTVKSRITTKPISLKNHQLGSDVAIEELQISKL